MCLQFLGAVHVFGDFGADHGFLGFGLGPFEGEHEEFERLVVELVGALIVGGRVGFDGLFDDGDGAADEVGVGHGCSWGERAEWVEVGLVVRWEEEKEVEGRVRWEECIIEAGEVGRSGDGDVRGVEFSRLSNYVTEGVARRSKACGLRLVCPVQMISFFPKCMDPVDAFGFSLPVATPLCLRSGYTNPSLNEVIQHTSLISRQKCQAPFVRTGSKQTLLPLMVENEVTKTALSPTPLPLQSLQPPPNFSHTLSR